MLKKIIKCSASWCAPCRTYAPIFDKVSETYKDRVTFQKIDVDGASKEENDWMNEIGIRSIPTTVLLDENDDVMKKIIGSVSENDLTTVIEDSL